MYKKLNYLMCIIINLYAMNTYAVWVKDINGQWVQNNNQQTYILSGALPHKLNNAPDNRIATQPIINVNPLVQIVKNIAIVQHATPQVILHTALPTQQHAALIQQPTAIHQSIATTQQSKPASINYSLLNAVKDRQTSLELVRIAKKYNVDLSKELPSFSNENNSSISLDNDHILEHKSNDDKKLLYIEALRRLDQDNSDDASGVAGEINTTQQPELSLYDELLRIATDTTNTRVNNLIIDSVLPSSVNISRRIIGANQTVRSGISAGDDKNMPCCVNSVWVRGLYGSINQGLSAGLNGFTGITKGGTIGVDAHLVNDIIVGLSYTRMFADFKYKGPEGNRVNTTNDVFSLYSVGNINDNFVLNALISIGKTKVKQQTRHLIGANKFKTATGKFTVTTYSVGSILNYKVPMNNPEIYVVPNIGLRFNRNSDGGYREYGTGIYNLDVSSKNHVSYAAITGVKMGKVHRVSDKLAINTGIHAEIEHYIYNKTSKAKTKASWVDNFTETHDIKIKTEKTGYNLGASLSASGKVLEVLGTYNVHLRGKYTSHQGSLRFKLLL